MKYELTVADNNYLIIKSFVPMTTQFGRDCGPEMMKLSTANGINKFMFDLRRTPNVQSVTKNIDFAYNELPAFGFPKVSRSAFLVSPDDSSHDFITSVFLKAGYDVKLFTEEDAALQWLNSSNKGH